MQIGELLFNVPNEDYFSSYLEELRKGFEIILIRKSRMRAKILTVENEDRLQMSYKHESKKKKNQISINSIVQIRRECDWKLNNGSIDNGTSVNFVIAEMSADREKVISTLQYLKQSCERNERNQNETLLIERTFNLGDCNDDGRLSLKEIINLLRRLHLKISKEKVISLFQEVQLDESPEFMSQEEFKLFYNKINNRKEIKRYFDQFARSLGGEFWMMAPDLQRFLEKRQKESRSLVYCENVIQLFGSDRRMSIYNFISVLRSSLNDLSAEGLEQSMDRPLHEYYVATSHNTYLMEHQLHGPSSVCGYIRCLLSGCRCVELDCYDGIREPRITHGFTMTGNVSFRKVVETINRYAFSASPYPVILSLEDHCSPVGQDQMAAIFRAVFKDRLYVPDQKQFLPSPAQLKYRIIIKNRKTEGTGPSPSFPCLSRRKSSHSLAPVIGLPTTKFHGLDDRYSPKTICSLSESEAQRLLGDSPDCFSAFCNSLMVKIYPKAARSFNSTNLNPIPFWSAGASIAAINYQYMDESSEMNSVMFASSGGYLLKPSFLRNPGCHPTPRTVWVTVISGIEIPNCQTKKNDIVDPFVTVTLMGTESVPQECHTSSILNNGFNPCWNEKFKFEVRSLETAFVKFTVMDVDSIGPPNFVGHKIFKLTQTRRGIRSVHLLDKSCESVGMGCLLVKIKYD